MSLIAEQLFKFAASAQWDLGDDTSLVNLYLPQGPHQGEKEPVSIQDVQTLLFGIHTAGSLEAMSFARELEAHWPSFVSVVKNAAGANKAFEMLLKDMGMEYAPERISQEGFTALSTKMVSTFFRRHPPKLLIWFLRHRSWTRFQCVDHHCL